MAKVKTNFASLTDAQKSTSVDEGGAKNVSTGYDFSSLADSDTGTSVSTESSAQPSKKKVDTELSGQTGLLVSSFKPKNPLFDSREELVAIAEREKNLTPEEKAKRAESVMAVNEYQVTTGGLGYGTGLSLIHI
jgi:hypothetical protein